MKKKRRTKRKKTENLFSKIKAIIQKKNKKRDKEYSKRMLSKIVNHSMLMMWASYILAWYGKIEIAESLSKTIATSVIAVVVGYLAKSVIENISKNTTAFGENVTPINNEWDNINDEDNDNDDYFNNNRDC